jgi:RimJ/RimL family protein N-acetyltransferase
VIEDKDNNILGTVGLHQINWQNRTAILGILIGVKSRWGQGVGTEAEKLIVNHAFNIGLRKIIAHVFHPNIAPAKALMKNGFKQEGCLKKQRYKNGEWVDELIFSLFKEEFTV